MLPEASAYAHQVDGIFWMLVGISAAIMLLVGSIVLFFAIKYRRGSNAKRGKLPSLVSREVEIGWTAVTLFAFLFVFWFAASSQTSELRVPSNAVEIHVVAKQWMWKIEHPGGQREIDALHVPVGVPIRLVMTSQDVIHDFYVPAFRLKQDVLPGRYVQTWFQATRVGTYRFFCAEYCGTDHARMLGAVTVMTPGDYARWSAGQPQGDTLAQQGASVYDRLGCAGCHGPNSRVPAPRLAGLYGSNVALQGGGFVMADEDYLRSAILDPQRHVVAGYPPIMPSYQDVASEEDVIRLIAYLRTPNTRAGQ